MLQKSPTGIAGLDEITSGGLPAGRVSLVTGDTGAGKTILAVQTLVNGATRFGEAGILVTFEERADELASDLHPFGWTLLPMGSEPEPPAASSAVWVLDANLSPETVYGGEFDISGLLSALTEGVRRTGAKRVVFDGLDVLLDLLDEPRQRRREIARLRDWTRSSGVTSIVTAKSLDEAGQSQKEGYDFLRFMVSCVVALRKNPQEGSVARTARILKLRGSGHSSSEHPLIIRDDGMIIGDVGSTRLTYDAPNEHVSSGVGRLDVMLGGGYYRASSVLISGAPGTAKSTLSGAFVDAACERGERALLVSFDEAFAQIERNLASVNIRLQRHVDVGLLETAGFRTGRLSAEEHFHQLMELVERHKPQVLVIDPISALDKVVGSDLAGDLAERLIGEAKVRGITMVMTSLLESAAPGYERTRVQISSIADTWIHLSFNVLDGERNRAVTIIKSRGNAHSNQVRELLVSDQGVTLADVFAQGGAVLMGTARLEKELVDKQDEDRTRREAEMAALEIEIAEARIKASLRDLQVELQMLQGRRSDQLRVETGRVRSHADVRSELLRSREGDGPELKASS